MTTDFLGREIKPGNVVLYPVRRGSDMWLSKMTVTQVEETRLKGYNPLGRRVELKNLKNVVVVDAKD